MTPFRKNFEILFRKFHDHADSHFVFKFHGNRPQEVGATMRCFGDKKFAKFGCFRRHFVPVWRRAPKVCRLYHAMWPYTSPYKISSQSVPTCRSHSRKNDFVRIQPWAYNKRTVNVSVWTTVEMDLAAEVTILVLLVSTLASLVYGVVVLTDKPQIRLQLSLHPYWVYWSPTAACTAR